MRLTFIGKDPDSNPTGSPTVYRTDRETWVVQGRMVTDPDVIAQIHLNPGIQCKRETLFYRKGRTLPDHVLARGYGRPF